MTPEQRRERNARIIRLRKERLAKLKPDQFAQHVQKQREHRVRSRYGSNSVVYKRKKLSDQNGKCAICKCDIEFNGHLDHNHVTGQYRGVLCHGCNVGLGFFKDNSIFLLSAIKYLREYAEQSSGAEGSSLGEPETPLRAAELEAPDAFSSTVN